MKKYYNCFYSVELTRDKLIKALKQSSDWNMTLQELCLKDQNPGISSGFPDFIIGWNQFNSSAEVGKYHYNNVTKYTFNCVSNETCEEDSDGYQDNFEIVTMCDFNASDIDWLRDELAWWM